MVGNRHASKLAFFEENTSVEVEETTTSTVTCKQTLGKDKCHEEVERKATYSYVHLCSVFSSCTMCKRLVDIYIYFFYVFSNSVLRFQHESFAIFH